MMEVMDSATSSEDRDTPPTPVGIPRREPSASSIEADVDWDTTTDDDSPSAMNRFHAQSPRAPASKSKWDERFDDKSTRKATDDSKVRIVEEIRAIADQEQDGIISFGVGTCRRAVMVENIEIATQKTTTQRKNKSDIKRTQQDPPPKDPWTVEEFVTESEQTSHSPSS
jgi:hypothetical protein